MKKYRDLEYKRRRKNAQKALSKIYINNNGDLYRVPHFRAMHTKALPHNDNDDVDEKEFCKFIKAVEYGNPKYIDQIRLGTPGGLKPVSPRDLFNSDLFGKYLAGYRLPLSWTLGSKRAAAELLEVYAMALARDIPFREYKTHPLIKELCSDLSLLKDAPFPRQDGQVTPETIFRGPTKGDLIGPYLSQFLLQPFRYGLLEVTQMYNCAQPGIDYLTTVEDYLDCHNGKVPRPAVPPSKEKTYLHTLRDGASWILVDEPVQAVINAAYYLLNNGYKFNQGNPYVNGTLTNQANFVDLGRVDFLDMISRASKIVMNAAWWYKYTQFVLRPEEFGFRVSQAKLGYPQVKLSKQLLNSPILDKVKEKYGTYLVPQAYNSGCPCHSSYPSGHAVLAGAMVTLVKAWFDGDQKIKIYEPSADGKSLLDTGEESTIEHELNKLASNCGILRNAAGIHYAQDAYNGMVFGEQIAIELLKEFVSRYDLPVTFQFRTFSGETLRISNR